MEGTIKVFLLKYVIAGGYRMVSFLSWFYDLYVKGNVPNGMNDMDLQIKDIDIPLKGRTLPTRVYYNPKRRGVDHKTKTKNVMIYFHGGGGCIGSIYTTHDCCLRVFASELDCVAIVGVEYRLAPAHPFPSGPNDWIDSAQWIIQNVKDLVNAGVSDPKFYVAGDSKGGEAALLAGIYDDSDKVHGIIALYPTILYSGTDGVKKHRWKSYDSMGGMTHKLPKLVLDMFMWGLLEGKSPKDFYHENNDETRSKAFPLLTSDDVLQKQLTNKKAMIILAGYDMLKDEGQAMIDKLETLGINCYSSYYKGEEHGFMCTNGRTASFEKGLMEMKSFME